MYVCRASVADVIDLSLHLDTHDGTMARRSWIVITEEGVNPTLSLQA
jgi:hypothetical protein